MEMRSVHGANPSGRGYSAVWNLLVVLGFWLCLYLAYAVVVAPIYGYLGMGWVEHDNAIVLVNLATLLTFSIFLPKEISKPSSLIVWMLFLIIAVGASFVPLVSGWLQGGDSWNVTAIACGSVLIIRILCLSPAPETFRLKISWRAYFQGVSLIAVAVNVSVFSFTGFSLNMPGLNDVYDARLAFRDVVETLPLFVGYAMPLAANVLNPLVLIVAVHLRQYWMAVLLVVFQLALYSVDGQKMILLIPAVVVCVYILVRVRGQISSRLLVISMLVLVTIVSILAISGGRVIFEVAVRRLFLIPAQLLGGYYDYFGQYGFAYLQHSRFFNAGTLTPEPGYIIGQYMFGSTVQNANASIISDGFANFGILGVICVGLVCGFIVRVMDSFTRNVPPAIALSVVAPAVIVLANNALQTALLTGGIFALLVMLYFMPSDLSPENTPTELGRRPVGLSEGRTL